MRTYARVDLKHEIPFEVVSGSPSFEIQMKDSLLSVQRIVTQLGLHSYGKSEHAAKASLSPSNIQGRT